MTLGRIIAPMAGAIAILILVMLWQSASHRAETAERDLKAETDRANGQTKRAGQLEQTALKRLADDAEVAAIGKGMNDAISAAPAGTPSAASVALNCDRLRRAGATSDAFKHICGGH
ncbi:MAG: hypothetical protein P0Y64_02140 [Candidatus Sphingomonas colombiensis]|nr:hypothetical protein [Sphingomonas sp.]WEK43656.1 MAG: hypothetical protein P0Y64_02140 [Sphingomonas sp.]